MSGCGSVFQPSNQAPPQHSCHRQMGFGVDLFLGRPPKRGLDRSISSRLYAPVERKAQPAAKDLGLQCMEFNQMLTCLANSASIPLLK
jgi:hypothetical protein